jgi:hypothetical protein
LTMENHCVLSPKFWPAEIFFEQGYHGSLEHLANCITFRVVLIIYYPWRQIDDHAVPTTTPNVGWGATTCSRVYITKTEALACRTQAYHLAPKNIRLMATIFPRPP